LTIVLVATAARIFSVASAFTCAASPTVLPAVQTGRMERRDAMTTPSALCCCGRPYKDRGGASSHHCPAGKRKLCEECATEGKTICPTHQERVSFTPRAVVYSAIE
jgi:hypothetical protein